MKLVSATTKTVGREIDSMRLIRWLVADKKATNLSNTPCTRNQKISVQVAQKGMGWIIWASMRADTEKLTVLIDTDQKINLSLNVID